MRKSFLFAAAGAGLLITGCTDSIMGEHRYRTIPVDDIPYSEKSQSGNVELTAPDKIDLPQPAPVKKVQYAPMTGAVSSGGVDSVPGKAAVPSKKSGKTAAAATGTYIVKRGDTPERIARRHKIRLSDLMNANNLDEASARRLQIGQKLTIPAGKVSGRAITKTSKNSAAAAEPAPTLDGGKYTVKSGDTPERIARRFKIKLNDLLNANNLDEASARRLQIGQKLTIPGLDVPATDGTAAAPAATTDATASIPSETDTTTTIVTDSTSTPSATDTINTTVDVAPVDTTASSADSSGSDVDIVEVPSDMTFAEFAASQGLSEEALRNSNGGTTKTTLQKGDILFVPKK